MKKTYVLNHTIRALAALATITLGATSAHAQGYPYDDQETVKNPASGYGGVGGGVDVTGSGTGGSAVSMDAQARILGFIDGREDSHDHHLIGYIDGRFHYNTVGFANGKTTTGVKGDAQLLMGYTPADEHKIKGCDIYLAGSGTLGAGVHRGLEGSDRLVGYFGVETGPICYLGEAVLMFSPTVQIGGVENDLTRGGEGEHDEGLVLAGARLRGSLHDRAMINLEALASVKGGEKDENNYKMLRASADLKLSDTWWLNAYVRGIDEENESGIIKRSRVENEIVTDYREGPTRALSGEAGVSVIRAF